VPETKPTCVGNMRTPQFFLCNADSTNINPFLLCSRWNGNCVPEITVFKGRGSRDHENWMWSLWTFEALSERNAIGL